MNGAPSPQGRNGLSAFSWRIARFSPLLGLWESWADTTGSVVETCTILAKTAKVLVADVHNRMPVILKPGDCNLWLDPHIQNPAMLANRLKPSKASLMTKYPVSARVNRPENNDLDCAQEISISAAQPALF